MVAAAMILSMVFGTVCVGDVDRNSVVDSDDLFAVLNAWGPCRDCPEDIDLDGNVAGDDLDLVTDNWGYCMTTVTIRPDSSTGFDTYVEGPPSQTVNHSTSQNLIFRKNVGTEAFPIMRFDLTPYIGMNILSAELDLVASASNPESYATFLCRMTTSDWVASQATYSIKSTGNAWDTAWSSSAGPFTFTNSIPFGSPTGSGPLVFDGSDMLTLVQDAIDNRSGYLQLTFFQMSTATSNIFTIGSSKNSVEANRPALILNYTNEKTLTGDGTPAPPAAGVSLIQSDPFPLVLNQTILRRG